jgi:putative Ca2+/H+ antiporter (TMEM165/GDT1 family)
MPSPCGETRHAHGPPGTQARVRFRESPGIFRKFDMEAFLVSAGAVLLGEIGDKTMLLALVLATRFRKPWPVIAGILVATLLNHALAGLIGGWVRTVLPADWLPWIVGGLFIAVGLWALVPDKLDDDDEANPAGNGSAFFVTTIAFFLAEIGDKTQIATTLLAARFESLLAVVAGTTTGMMLADVPVIFVGAALATKLPLKAIRIIAAALFIALGVTTLIFRSSFG